MGHDGVIAPQVNPGVARAQVREGFTSPGALKTIMMKNMERTAWLAESYTVQYSVRCTRAYVTAPSKVVAATERVSFM